MESAKAKPGLQVASKHKYWRTRRSSAARGYWGKLASLLGVCILLGFTAPPARGAQNDSNKVEFLVARNQIHDPFFQHSVVLMLPSVKSPLIVGLIVNKPTRMTIDKLFPDSPEFSSHTEPAYFGGPVRVAVASLIFQASSVPKHALGIFGNVYLTLNPSLITSVFKNSQSSSKLRLFLGRSQWGPGQLKNEMQEGAWYKVHADGNLIFSANPQSLWRTLHSRAAPSKYIKYPLPPASKTFSKKSPVM